MMMRSRNTLGVNERDYDDEIEEYLRRKREKFNNDEDETFFMTAKQTRWSLG